MMFDFPAPRLELLVAGEIQISFDISQLWLLAVEDTK